MVTLDDMVWPVQCGHAVARADRQASERRALLNEEKGFFVNRPLEGVKIVEVAMWAFVPSCGAILADMGAEVIKVEAAGGDPIRGLTSGGIKPGQGNFQLMWEMFNRGKRSISLDLGAEGALEVLHRLLGEADVFLTSLLPPARRKLGIDIEDLMSRHPRLIYAIGNGQGMHGPDAEKGGYDAISYWARASVSASITPDSLPFPLPMPGGAFGDVQSGTALAGGVAAALFRRERTGKASVVDTALLGAGMWAMQASICGTRLAGLEEMPKPGRTVMPNPLVNFYKTSDNRFVSLCMLQGQRYWPGLCKAIGREDLATDPRFAAEADRVANIEECIAELDAEFATRPLAEWKAALATQSGQWDVVQKSGELGDDPAARANGFAQDVDYGDGRTLMMVSAPMQFDRQYLKSRPAPELGADSDAVLAEVGYDEEQIIDLKVAGIVN